MSNRPVSLLIGSVLAALSILSCTQREEYDWSWVDSLGKDYPVELEAFNSRWNLAMTNVIDPDVYSFDGSGSLLTSYTDEADINAALKVAGYLEKEIFPLFPEEMITRYMPSRIFVADSVYIDFYDECYDAELIPSLGRWKQIHTENEVRRSLYGDVGANHLTLSSSIMDDPDAQEELKFNCTSLIIERMMANASLWKPIEDFIYYSENRYRELESVLTSYKFYQTSLSNGENYFRITGSDTPGDWCYWYYCGSIRGSRCFYSGRCLFTEDFMKATGGEGTDTIQCWYRLTYRQDFADLLAFMLLNSPEEQEAYLAGMDGWSWDSGKEGDKIYTISRETFEKKMKYIKDFLKENFNWTIE